MPAQTVIKVRRDTASNWTTANPTLASGEIGFETNTNKLKVGNGSTAWTSLAYASGAGGVTIAASAPTGVEAGTIWFDSNTGISYVYYDSTWVELAPAIIGPQGPAGETGPAGPTGATGPTGADGASGIPTPVSVNSNITLSTGNRYFVDTSAARTLTLPASPTMGDEVQIFDAAGTAATNNITVSNNSLKINGVTDSAVLDVNGVAAVFIYTGSTYGWRMG